MRGYAKRGIWAGIVLMVLGGCLPIDLLAQEGPQRAEDWFKLGLKYQEGDEVERDLAKALRCYQRAAQMDPRRKEAFYNIGLICDEMERYKAAIEAFRRAIKIDPKFAPAYSNLGVIYQKLKNLTAAKNLYLKAVELDSTLHIAHYNLSTVYLEEGEGELALREIHKALEYDPKNPLYNDLMGKIEGHEGQSSLSQWTVLAIALVAIIAIIVSYALGRSLR